MLFCMYVKNVRRFFSVNWLKSAVVNIYYFGIKKGLRFPILIGYGVKIAQLGDRNSIIVPNKFASLCYGLKKDPFNLGTEDSYWYIGEKARLRIEGTCRMSKGTRLKLFPNSILEIGDGFTSNANLIISCSKRIKFGQDVLLGWDISIMDNDGGHQVISKEGNTINIPMPILIGNHVWIGSCVSILKNTIIGDNCIVGYKSNLCGLQAVDNNQMIVGNPAKARITNTNWLH